MQYILKKKGEKDMKEKKMALANVAYGDVCMRSKSNSVSLFDQAEYEEFEQELLDALNEVIEEEE